MIFLFLFFYLIDTNYIYINYFSFRGSTREKALASIIESFNSSLQNEFVEAK